MVNGNCGKKKDKSKITLLGNIYTISVGDGTIM